MTEFVSPQLRTVLKTFQDTATKSLQGPGGHQFAQTTSPLPVVVKKEQFHNGSRDGDDDSMSEEDQLIVAPPPAPELPQPILSAADTGCGTLYETILEGKRIGCFLLGGELRLCLPQILNNVLMDFNLDQINCTCERLQIFCSQCTPEQLAEFKAAKILPDDVKTSGLITRTNAERLCSALLHRGGEKIAINVKNSISFRVYHRCFGKAEGICTPEMYSLRDPSCIECLDCLGMFSPQKFVCHGHGRQEEQTCHWGFDSGNWRAYVHVSLEEKNRDKFTKMLDELRDREYQETVEFLNMQRDSLKRKGFDDDKQRVGGIGLDIPGMELLDRDAIPHKKSKYMLDDAAYFELQQYRNQIMWTQYHQQHHHYPQLAPVFQPFALTPKCLSSYVSVINNLSFLNQQEPPLLQNPERVIRMSSENERFGRSFQPNVALAPKQQHAPPPQQQQVVTLPRTKVELTPVKSPQPLQSTTVDIVKVKQERPITPNDNTILVAPNCGITISKFTPPTCATRSPEQFSNEITSSTSPLPGKLDTKSVTIEPILIKPELSPTELSKLKRPPLVNGKMTPIIGNCTGSGVIGNPEFELSTDTDDESVTGEADSSNVSAMVVGPWDIAQSLLKDTQPVNRDKVLNIIKILVHENMQLRQASKQKDDQIHELQSLLKCRYGSNRPNGGLIEPNIVVKPETIVDSNGKTFDEPIRSVSPRLPNGTYNGVTISPQTIPNPISDVSVESPVTHHKLKHKAIMEMHNSNNHNNINNNSSNSTTITAIKLPPKKQHDVIMKPLKKSLRRSPDTEQVDKKTEHDEDMMMMGDVMESKETTPQSPVIMQPKKHLLFLSKHQQQQAASLVQNVEVSLQNGKDEESGKRSPSPSPSLTISSEVTKTVRTSPILPPATPMKLQCAVDSG